MPLYLDEIYLNASNPENAKRSLTFFAEVFKGGFPPGVTLVAGPWMSNEEPKVVLVLDIKDHSLTFNPFTKALAQGIVLKRRLEPIVDWNDALKLASEL
jgi:hypothetical protein